jgi:anti-sigma regulatory factor (Ser/Thr protein kinase)
VPNAPDVFIVESHNELRQWMSKILTSVGWDVQSSEKWDLGNNAESAPGWLLMDADEFPGDWMKTLNDFRKDNPSTRILLAASHTDPVRLLSWLRGGIGRVLAKPFTRGELFSALGLEDRYPSPSQDTILHWMSGDSRIRRGVKDWIELETVSGPGLEAWLSRWLELYLSHRVPESLLRDIRIGVGEMLGNAIEWGNRNRRDAKIYLSCALFPDQVIIHIRDEGPGFDPGDVPEPSKNPFKVMNMRKTQGKRVGGYGLFLAKKVTSELLFNNAGNGVMLVWRFDATPAKNGVTA